MKIMFKRSDRHFVMLSGVVFAKNLIIRNAQIIAVLRPKHNFGYFFIFHVFLMSLRDTSSMLKLRLFNLPSEKHKCSE